MEKHSLHGHYVALPVRLEHVDQVLQTLPHMGFIGSNVTVPYKEQVYARVRSHCDASAQRIGAVNTLVWRQEHSEKEGVNKEDRSAGERGSTHGAARPGYWWGANTDAYGFMTHLKKTYPKYDFAHAVVLGAGGAARAVAAGLLGQKHIARVTLINRTAARAEAIAAWDARIAVASWADTDTVLGSADLLVNTTSLGMQHMPPLEISLDALPTSAVVADIVYAPLHTPLLLQAQARGNPTLHGLGMLLHQAAAAFELWFGILPKVDETLYARIQTKL